MTFHTAIKCPECGAAPIDTVVDAPFVRGFLVGFTYGSKRFVGCSDCVRKKLIMETGLSMVAGWWSFRSLLVNPMCILWNGLRVPFVRPSPARVEKLLRELGLPSGMAVDLPRVASALAVSMIVADGKVLDSEVRVAIQVGTQVVPGMSQEMIVENLQRHKTLPSAQQLAGLLHDSLDAQGKMVLLKYLMAIAAADGEIDLSEVRQIETVARAMGVDPTLETDEPKAPAPEPAEPAAGAAEPPAPAEAAGLS